VVACQVAPGGVLSGLWDVGVRVGEASVPAWW
jgi:hypothetical protein